MTKKIKCADCRFATVDRNASEKGWTAYECGNRKSEYYKSLLNVTPNGDRQHYISWSGCSEGRVKQ